MADPSKEFTLGLLRNMQAPPTPLVTAPGMRVQGNLDMSRRPSVPVPGGGHASIRSMSVGLPQGEVLIPTVSPHGVLMTDDEAFDLFRKTDQHLGVFDTPEQASAYADLLHRMEEARGRAGRVLDGPGTPQRVENSIRLGLRLGDPSGGR